MAQGFGISEVIIGRGLAQGGRRDRIVLANKVYRPTSVMFCRKQRSSLKSASLPAGLQRRDAPKLGGTRSVQVTRGSSLMAQSEIVSVKCKNLPSP